MSNADEEPPPDAAALPPLGIIALNRMGFGPRPGDLEAFEALGQSDGERLESYVDSQLDPSSYPDADLAQRLEASGFTTLTKSAEQLWADHVATRPSYSTRTLPFREMERAVFMRALYSERQLLEDLADFWHNHFNVYANDYWAGPMWVHYDREVIRGNMLGNFRRLLEDVATSVPMLYYLDNYTNTNAGPNENFARELFELHGLGAENYLGVKRQHEVPLDPQGSPVGYVDDDVYEATRCFTGWTIDFDSGKVRFEGGQHDRFQKRVLGHYIPTDQGPFKDGQDVLDLIAAHPGTGRHLARKLCRRLIADHPPSSIVNQAAEVFTDNVEAPDQLAKVVRTILLSPEFRSTWGQKIKRPFELIVSSMRALNVDFNCKLADTAADWFMRTFALTGQAPFQWHPPDGYPDLQEDWLGSSSLIMSWRLLNSLVEVKNWWSGAYIFFDVVRDTPANFRTAKAITDFWIQRVLGRPLSPANRSELVDFMARGRNPDMDLPLEREELVQERLWALVGILMMSPENHLR